MLWSGGNIINIHLLSPCDYFLCTRINGNKSLSWGGWEIALLLLMNVEESNANFYVQKWSITETEHNFSASLLPTKT